MLTPTDPIAHIARVAFVTRRFHELRGLITASFGGALIVAAWMVHAAGAASSFGSGPMQALIFANCVYVMALIVLDRSYRQTYGDVVATAGQKFASGLMPFVVMSGALCDMFLQSVSGRGPSIAGAMFMAYAIWIALRDWRWRIHYLAAAAAGAAAAVVTAAVPGPFGRWGEMDAARADAFLLAQTLIALGMVAVGLFDHRLLAQSLGSPAPESTAEPRRSRGVAPRLVTTALVFGVAAAGFLYWGATWPGQTLPAVLMLALILTQTVTALHEAARAGRELNRGGRVSLPAGQVLQLKADALVLLFLVAVAAVVEDIVGVRGLFALALSLSIAWIAIGDWPHRKRYLVAAAGAAALAVLTRNTDPARAFAMLVCAVSVAIVLEGLFTYRTGTRHADTV
jgi:hypothetical protein